MKFKSVARHYFRMGWLIANKTFTLLKLIRRKNKSCKKEIYTVFFELKFSKKCDNRIVCFIIIWIHLWILLHTKYFFFYTKHIKFSVKTQRIPGIRVLPRTHTFTHFKPRPPTLSYFTEYTFSTDTRIFGVRILHTVSLKGRTGNICG